MKCPGTHIDSFRRLVQSPDLEPVYNRGGDQIGWFCRACRRFSPGAGQPQTFGEKCRATRARNRLPAQRHIAERLTAAGPQSVRELCNWSLNNGRPYLGIPSAESTMRDWLARMEKLGMVTNVRGQWSNVQNEGAR